MGGVYFLSEESNRFGSHRQGLKKKRKRGGTENFELEFTIGCRYDMYVTTKKGDKETILTRERHPLSCGEKIDVHKEIVDK